MTLDLGMEYSALGLGYSLEWSFQNINIRLIRYTRYRSVWNGVSGLGTEISHGLGVQYITLQDNLIISTVWRWLRTIFPYAGWTSI